MFNTMFVIAYRKCYVEYAISGGTQTKGIELVCERVAGHRDRRRETSDVTHLWFPGDPPYNGDT